jgi:hypothetical protein
MTTNGIVYRAICAAQHGDTTQQQQTQEWADARTVPTHGYLGNSTQQQAKDERLLHCHCGRPTLSTCLLLVLTKPPVPPGTPLLHALACNGKPALFAGFLS